MPKKKYIPELKDLKLKCEICKGKIDFYFHKCGRGIGEYLGCAKCDNECGSCKKEQHISTEKEDQINFNRYT